MVIIDQSNQTLQEFGRKKRTSESSQSKCKSPEACRSQDISESGQSKDLSVKKQTLAHKKHSSQPNPASDSKDPGSSSKLPQDDHRHGDQKRKRHRDHRDENRALEIVETSLDQDSHREAEPALHQLEALRGHTEGASFASGSPIIPVIRKTPSGGGRVKSLYSIARKALTMTFDSAMDKKTSQSQDPTCQCKCDGQNGNSDQKTANSSVKCVHQSQSDQKSSRGQSETSTLPDQSEPPKLVDQSCASSDHRHGNDPFASSVFLDSECDVCVSYHHSHADPEIPMDRTEAAELQPTLPNHGDRNISRAKTEAANQRPCNMNMVLKSANEKRCFKDSGPPATITHGNDLSQVDSPVSVPLVSTTTTHEPWVMVRRLGENPAQTPLHLQLSASDTETEQVDGVKNTGSAEDECSFSPDSHNFSGSLHRGVNDLIHQLGLEDGKVREGDSCLQGLTMSNTQPPSTDVSARLAGLSCSFAPHSAQTIKSPTTPTNRQQRNIFDVITPSTPGRANQDTFVGCPGNTPAKLRGGLVACPGREVEKQTEHRGQAEKEPAKVASMPEADVSVLVDESSLPSVARLLQMFNGCDSTASTRPSRRASEGCHGDGSRTPPPASTLRRRSADAVCRTEMTEDTQWKNAGPVWGRWLPATYSPRVMLSDICSQSNPTKTTGGKGQTGGSVVAVTATLGVKEKITFDKECQPENEMDNTKVNSNDKVVIIDQQIEDTRRDENKLEVAIIEQTICKTSGFENEHQTKVQTTRQVEHKRFEPELGHSEDSGVQSNNASHQTMETSGQSQLSSHRSTETSGVTMETSQHVSSVTTETTTDGNLTTPMEKSGSMNVCHLDYNNNDDAGLRNVEDEGKHSDGKIEDFNQNAVSKNGHEQLQFRVVKEKQRNVSPNSKGKDTRKRHNIDEKITQRDMMVDDAQKLEASACKRVTQGEMLGAAPEVSMARVDELFNELFNIAEANSAGVSEAKKIVPRAVKLLTGGNMVEYRRKTVVKTELLTEDEEEMSVETKHKQEVVVDLDLGQDSSDSGKTKVVSQAQSTGSAVNQAAAPPTEAVNQSLAQAACLSQPHGSKKGINIGQNPSKRRSISTDETETKSKLRYILPKPSNPQSTESNSSIKSLWSSMVTLETLRVKQKPTLYLVPTSQAGTPTGSLTQGPTVNLVDKQFISLADKLTTQSQTANLVNLSVQSQGNTLTHSLANTLTHSQADTLTHSQAHSEPADLASILTSLPSTHDLQILSTVLKQCLINVHNDDFGTNPASNQTSNLKNIQTMMSHTKNSQAGDYVGTTHSETQSSSQASAQPAPATSSIAALSASLLRALNRLVDTPGALEAAICAADRQAGHVETTASCDSQNGHAERMLGRDQKSAVSSYERPTTSYDITGPCEQLTTSLKATVHAKGASSAYGGMLLPGKLLVPLHTDAGLIPPGRGSSDCLDPSVDRPSDLASSIRRLAAIAAGNLPPVSQQSRTDRPLTTAASSTTLPSAAATQSSTKHPVTSCLSVTCTQMACLKHASSHSLTTTSSHTDTETVSVIPIDRPLTSATIGNISVSHQPRTDHSLATAAPIIILPPATYAESVTLTDRPLTSTTVHQPLSFQPQVPTVLLVHGVKKTRGAAFSQHAVPGQEQARWQGNEQRLMTVYDKVTGKVIAEHHIDTMSVPRMYMYTGIFPLASPPAHIPPSHFLVHVPTLGYLTAKVKLGRLSAAALNAHVQIKLSKCGMNDMEVATLRLLHQARSVATETKHDDTIVASETNDLANQSASNSVVGTASMGMEDSVVNGDSNVRNVDVTSAGGHVGFVAREGDVTMETASLAGVMEIPDSVIGGDSVVKNDCETKGVRAMKTTTTSVVVSGGDAVAGRDVTMDGVSLTEVMEIQDSVVRDYSVVGGNGTAMNNTYFVVRGRPTEQPGGRDPEKMGEQPQIGAADATAAAAMDVSTTSLDEDEEEGPAASPRTVPPLRLSVPRKHQQRLDRMKRRMNKHWARYRWYKQQLSGVSTQDEAGTSSPAAGEETAAERSQSSRGDTDSARLDDHTLCEASTEGLSADESETEEEGATASDLWESRMSPDSRLKAAVVLLDEAASLQRRAMDLVHGSVMESYDRIGVIHKALEKERNRRDGIEQKLAAMWQKLG